MLMALLPALGVDLVVVVFAMLVFGRRRWLKRQAGEFAGRIRVSGGATIEVAARAGHRALVTGPLTIDARSKSPV